MIYLSDGNESSSDVYAYASGLKTDSSIRQTWEDTIERCYNAGDIVVSTNVSAPNPHSDSWALGLDASRVVDSYNIGNISSVAKATDTVPARETNRDRTEVWYEYSAMAYSRAYGIRSEDMRGTNRCYNSGVVSSEFSDNTWRRYNPDPISYAATWGIDASRGISNSVVRTDKLFSNDNVRGFGITSFYDRYNCFEFDGTENYDQSFWEDTLGFDFDTVWKMPKDGGYPIFRGKEEGEDEGALEITRIISPSNAQLSNEPQSGGISGTITATVSSDTASQLIDIEPSISGTTWTLHRLNEQNEYVEVPDKKLPLKDGENTAFLELSAPGHEKKTYLVTIMRTGQAQDTPTVERMVRYDNGYDSGQTTVLWGASLFDTTSFVYDHDLARTASALNAAASGIASYLYGTDGAYDSLGFTNAKYYNYDAPYAITLDGSEKDEHCFSIASQEMIIDGEEQLVIAVVLRGTEGMSEVLGDIWASYRRENFYDNHMAYGYFYDYQEKVWNQFSSYINQDWVKAYDDRIKVLITGHSLGGAAANLFAAKFSFASNTVATENVYAFTFGALNSITTNGFDHKFGYINNIFNFFDTFGPNSFGDAPGGVKPAYGDLTISNKFGNILEFDNKDYKGVFDKGDVAYKNHVMACYVDALRQRDISDGKSSTRVTVLCPVDVEVYDNSNTLVGKTANNIVDENVTTIPMFVEGDIKYLSLSPDVNYRLVFTAFNSGEMAYLIETPGGTTPASIKIFEHVALVPGKVMNSMVGGNVDVPNVQLFVMSGDGQAAAEIQIDGTETDLLYNVSMQSDGNGIATASATSAAVNTEITLTAIPNSGYQFKEWQVIRGNVGIADNKFSMPANDVTVKAMFETIPDTDISYRIIGGADSSWKQGTVESMTITSNGELSKFVGVKVDSIFLGENDHAAQSGSTIVTLKQGYLETLSVGVHIVDLVFIDGSVQTTLTILGADSVIPEDSVTTPSDPTTSDTQLPSTGDNSNVFFWMTLGSIALSVCVGIIVFWRKKSTHLLK